MSKPAADILEEQIEWAQDKIIYAAIEHITKSFDSFPGVGIGLSFMKRSAEKMIVKRLENDVVPDIEEHIQLQMAYIQELAETDDPEAVEDAYRDKLLETDPFMITLDAPDNIEEELRTEVISHHNHVAQRTLTWLEDAGDDTYEDYADLVVRTGKTGDEVEQEIMEMLQYIEWLEEHKEHVDMSDYSTVLEHSKVHAWFLNALISGMKEGRSEVIKEVRERVEERQKLE